MIYILDKLEYLILNIRQHRWTCASRVVSYTNTVDIDLKAGEYTVESQSVYLGPVYCSRVLSLQGKKVDPVSHHPWVSAKLLAVFTLLGEIVWIHSVPLRHRGQ